MKTARFLYVLPVFVAVVFFFAWPITTGHLTAFVLPAHAQVVAERTYASAVSYYTTAQAMPPGHARDLHYQRAHYLCAESMAIYRKLFDAHGDPEHEMLSVKSNQLRYATHSVRLGYTHKPDFFFTLSSYHVWF